MKAYLSRPDGPYHALQMLMRYKAWAIDVMMQSAVKIPSEELTKERPTTFKSILNTLAHIYVVDEMFRAHIERREHGYSKRTMTALPSVEILWDKISEMDHWWVGFIDAQSPSSLTQIIECKFVDGSVNPISVEEILHHLVNHTIYHIGYVSDMMYQIPAEPPTTDLPVFLREVWRP